MNPPPLVICGDSSVEVPKLGKFDIVVTDPPYAPGSRRKEWKPTGSTSAALYNAARSVRPGGTMLVLCAASARGLDHVRSSIEPILPLSRMLVWRKKFVRSPAAGPWRWDIVPVLVFGRGVFGRPNASSSVETGGPNSNSGYAGTGHPAEVPAEVAQWLLAPFADGLRLRVLDPFAGSGALLEPAVERGWDAVGVEQDAHWARVARSRLLSVRRKGEVA